MTRGITGKLISTGRMPRSSYHKESTCARCGTTFERLSADWGWYLGDGKGGKTWYCSYKCMRAAEAEKKPSKYIKAHV